MRTTAGGVILGWLFLATACPPLCADGGSLRFSAVQGGYRISVFTAPAPFRQGPVDISVLVQDPGTGELMASTRVTVRMTKAGQAALEYPATAEAATNKLFRAAQFELPASGRWEWRVEVDGSGGLAVVSGELEAAAASPRWQELWIWIGWPAVAVALFGIHQVLVRRKQSSQAVLSCVDREITMH
ncbi:MAG: hypothetical protein ACLQIB_45790 [Isosphaeraceae bacterium]